MPTQWLQNSVESGERSVLTLGSVYRTTCGIQREAEKKIYAI